MQMNSEFFNIHLGNVIEIGVVILAYLGYKIETRKDSLEREHVRQSQAALHAENTVRLNSLIEYNRNQIEVNRQRDIQINLLSNQTTQLTAIAQGFDRRITMLENKI